MDTEKLLIKVDAIEKAVRHAQRDFVTDGYSLDMAKTLLTPKSPNKFFDALFALGSPNSPAYSVNGESLCLTVDTWFEMEIADGVSLCERYKFVWNPTGEWETVFRLDDFGYEVQKSIEAIDLLSCARYEAEQLLCLYLKNLSASDLTLEPILGAIERVRLFCDPNFDPGQVIAVRTLCNQHPGPGVTQLIEGVLA